MVHKLLARHISYTHAGTSCRGPDLDVPLPPTTGLSEVLSCNHMSRVDSGSVTKLVGDDQVALIGG